MTQIKETIAYEEVFYEDLQNPEFAASLLNECLKNEDVKTFRVIVYDIIKANNISMTELASRVETSRPGLNKMLSEKGNPSMATFLGILNNLGFDLSVSIRPVKSRDMPRRSKKSAISA